ncbi:MAG: amidohydrolase family protein, partial [Calditrichaeota bacterium]|nr:amidohydrolase family protein [Calditrichota bacterium]
MMPLHSKPHLILYNSRIFDPASGRALAASALAVGGNRILALGSDADILSLAGPETERIDAGRRWLLPALTDAHTHLSGYATRKLQIDFTGCATIDEALAAIRTAVEATPPGRWITGGGWSKAGLGLSDFPDKRMLDEISTHHFLAFQSRDWHSVWVNSPVLD